MVSLKYNLIREGVLNMLIRAHVRSIIERYITDIEANNFDYVIRKLDYPGRYEFYTVMKSVGIDPLLYLESVPAHLFSGSDITEIRLPPNIKRLEENVFTNCNKLTKVYLPDNLTQICYGAFDNCSELQEIRLSPYTDLIATVAFRRCKNLTKIILPESITHIGADAFAECSKLNIYCESQGNPSRDTIVSEWNPSDCLIHYNYHGGQVI